MISNEKMFAVLVNEWAEAMSGYSQQSIQYGLDMVNKQGGDFAPTLPAFLNLCQPVHIYDHCYHLPPHQRPQNLLSADERAALPPPGQEKPPVSLYVQELRKAIEQKEKLKHADDDLDEKKRRFAESLQHVMESKR